MTDKIVSKGVYNDPGIPNFVSAKQYMVLRKGKRNQLIFRFENPKNEMLTAISFTVDCLDIHKNVIKTEKIEHSALKVCGLSYFVVNRPVTLPMGCADFKVTIDSVCYGDYRYITHGNEVEIVYDKRNKSNAINRIPLLHKLGGNTHKSIFRTLHAPKFFLGLFSLILSTMILVLGVKLYTFTSTEEFFTLDQVQYTFATENRKDGPIIIVGTNSTAENIIIPDQIEGHDVAAIGANAFSNSNVRTIVCEGSVEIYEEAFSNAHNLESIHIKSTKTIGEKAFYNCTNLTEIIIDNNLETIKNRAFDNCDSLENVSLPNSLKTIEYKAFANCDSLASFTIPDSTSYIGANVFENCSLLTSLQTPFIGESTNNLKTLSYFFKSNNQSNSLSPVRNLVVTKQGVIVENTFKNESNLVSVSFSGLLTEIGTEAFSKCTNLETFDIPVTVSTIGDSAFYNCETLTSITVPSGVTELADNTFYGCTELTTITLPTTLESIGENTFRNCSSLSSLEIPSSVTYMGDNALNGCRKLTKLTLPFLGNTVSSAPKTLANIIATGKSCSLEELTILSGSTLPKNAFEDFVTLKKIILPSQITNISDYCFQNCSALRELIIPHPVTTIGKYAFSKCTSLKSIEIPTLVTSTGVHAFDGCSSLASAVFRNNSTEIGAYAFKDCSSLTYLSLPSDLTSIPDYMCKGCSSLESVILPSTASEIKSYAFDNCSSLKSVVWPINLTTIGNNAFSSCQSLTSVQFASTVQTIGNYAFSDCKALTSITIPDTISSVGYSAFKNCDSVETITAPYPTKYSSGANLCYYFSGASLPETLKSITISSCYNLNLPNYAFNGCSNVEEIILPSNLTTIGNFAFINCSNLTSLIIPDSVTSIGYGSLIGTTNLENITLPYAGLTSYQYSDNGFRYLYYDQNTTFNYPENLHTVTITKATSIPYYAFSNMSSICHINMPNTITQIGNEAFRNCSSLREILLPASLTSIGYDAFAGCRRIYTVTNLSSIDVSSYFPYSLRIFTSEAETAAYTITIDNYTLLKTADDVWYLTEYDEVSTNLELPENVYYNFEVVKYELPSYLFQNADIETVNISPDVTKINSYAFNNCSNLTTVTSDYTTSFEEICAYAFYDSHITSIEIPASTTKIATYAFESADLESIIIPASVTTIEANAFAHCGYLTEISFEENSQLTDLQEYAFYNSGITDIILPASLTCINSNTFYNCSSLNSVSFEEGSNLSIINQYAFYNSGITEISLPASLQTISSYAFRSCSSLINVTIESGSQLTTIGYEAFAYSGILGIMIPNSLESIESNAFYDCDSLEQVLFEDNSSLESIGSYAFYGTSISNLVLPSSITYVGSYAFAYCYNLASVTLSSDFSCEYNVFESSSNILEVYNLTGNSLEIGSSSYGYVAYNAMIIHTDANAERLHDVQAEGFNFKKSDDNWFLMGLAEDNNSTEVNLTSFTYNGTLVDSYVVYKNAFYNNSNIESVTIDSAVTEILYRAFYACNNLSTLTFEENCVLDEIPQYAFSNCYNITSVSLPESLLVIDDYAFKHCINLEKITLPSSLIEIGYEAFEDCTKLYNIINLSELDIVAGSSNYGYVGYYALAVHDEDVSFDVITIETSSTSADFINYNDVWYLVRFNILSSSSSFIEIPKLTIEEEDLEYTIFRNALISLYNYYYKNVFISSNVTSIEDNALDCLSNHAIYFDGNAQEFSDLAPTYSGTVYTYLECFHESGLDAWRYDEDGGITTTPSQLEYTVIEEPTCSEEGSRKGTCPICEYEIEETLPATNEHTIEDDKCTVCNKVKQTVTTVINSENFSSNEFITNDTNYPFAINSSGVITSQNHNDSSYSSLVITANDTITVTFNYKVSSEHNYDFFTILLNGTRKINVSGESSYQSFSITLSAGDVLILKYTKDSSVRSGDDCAYIKDLTITANQMVEATL